MTSPATISKLQPPIARREEDRVVYAGAAPPDWPKEALRQAEGSKEKLMDPPVAVPDPYGWLRDDDRKDEAILAHLRKENEYTEEMTKHLEGLRKTLYDELLSAIQETDYSVPRPHGDYYRYKRTFEGKSYARYCRAPIDKSKPLKIEWDGKAESPILPGEETLLDVNVLAEGKDYCVVGDLALSPSKKLVAYSADFSGDEKYQLFVKDLETGKIIFEDPKLETSGSIEWGYTDDNIFYFTMDDTHRPNKLWRKRFQKLGDDEMIIEEPDPQFWAGAFKSQDEKILFYEVGSGETSEYWFLNLEEEAGAPTDTTKLQCIAKRRYKVLYDVVHRHGWWWISSKTGDETPNKRLFTAPAVANCEDQWTLVLDPVTEKPLFDGGYERAFAGVSCFSTHVIAHGREGGIPKVWVLSFGDEDKSTAPKVTKFEALTFEEEAYDVCLGSHYEFDVNSIMVIYDSMNTPPSYMEISLSDLSQRNVVKVKNVPGYKKEEFGCDRYFVTSRDGSTQIPVLRVYRKEVMEKHKADGKPVPTHLYGYGSYGICVEADFDSQRLPLLNRGMVYVMAQIRGGSEMGRQWYEEPNGAKYLCKKNTFNDFVDVARDLVETQKLTTPEMLSTEGRSAGGMLIGATINQAPELFKVAILGVPFLDVVCTMIDSRIPLTTNEWEEWGNVNEEKYFQYMMDYSPMQNVKDGARYPSCLLTCGLNDNRVAYWEAVKYAATLRHKQNPKSGPVCVKIEMSAGHFSASDRYKYLREKAFDYAFMLDQLGLARN